MVAIIKLLLPKLTSTKHFRYPRVLGTYEWVVMPFSLKNASTTYHCAMITIFHDLIKTIVEVYINYIVVKSKKF